MASHLEAIDINDNNVILLEEDTDVPHVIKKEEILLVEIDEVVIDDDDEDVMIILSEHRQCNSLVKETDDSVASEYFESIKDEVMDINDNTVDPIEEDIKVVYENIKDVKIRCELSPQNEIEVRYLSQITGFDVNCKEKLDMVRMGLPCQLGRQRDKFIFWCRVCHVELSCEDTVVKHVRGNNHLKKRLVMIKEKENK